MPHLSRRQRILTKRRESKKKKLTGRTEEGTSYKAQTPGGKGEEKGQKQDDKHSASYIYLAQLAALLLKKANELEGYLSFVPGNRLN